MRIAFTNSDKIAVYSAQDIFTIIQHIFYEKKDKADLMQEHFWTFALNKARKILNIELIGMGCRDRVIADPGDVFRVPLYKSSSYVILVHNHPSGSLHPSKEDIDLTNRLMKAGDILRISVIEHVIVTQTSYFSFQHSGLIDKLDLDSKYTLRFIHEKKIKTKMEQLEAQIEKEHKKGKVEGIKQGEKKGLEKGKVEGAKAEKKEIARQMLLDGEPVEKIKKWTGLTHQWIGRLKSEIDLE